MARLPRFSILGQTQHVIQRGNNRESIFVSEEDYVFYLEKLKDACQKYQCEIHAYALMTNHVHLLMTPYSENGISKVMQTLGRYYVQYFNYQYRRTGTLWEGRYRATLLDSEQYLLICSRYIEMNPVRAKMVLDAAEYPWSSYRCNAMGETNLLITPHLIYKALANTDNERQLSYQFLFENQMTELEIEEIRVATNKAWVLGNDRFREQIEKLTARQAKPKDRGGDRKSEDFKSKSLKCIFANF